MPGENKPAGKQTGVSQGSLTERPLEALLYQLHSAKASSQLVLEAGSARRSYSFRNGDFLLFSSNAPEESLYAFLESKGVLEKSKAEALRKADGGEGWALLAETGPSIPRFGELLREYFQSRGLLGFSMRGGSFSLKGLPPLAAKARSFPSIPVFAFLKSGIQQHYRTDYLAGKFDKLQSRVLVLTPAFSELITQLELSPAELEMVSRIDGRRTLTEVAVSDKMGVEQSLQLLWVLFSLRMLGLALTAEAKAEADRLKKEEETKKTAPPPLPPPAVKEVIDPKKLRAEIEERSKIFEKQNYFDVLGVDRKVPADVVRKTFLALAKRYHPDALAVAGLSDLSNKAGAIFARMSIAHETLIDPKARQEYEASLDMDPNLLSKMNNILNAEVEFQRGEIMLRNRSYAAALKQFETAIRLNPDEPEHHVYYAWTSFLTEKADKAKAAQTAKVAIEKALRSRSNMDSAYLFLGRMAKALNNLKEAEAYFNKALSVNSNNEEAEAELRVMARRK